MLTIQPKKFGCPVTNQILVFIKQLITRGPIEIVDLPLKNCGFFHRMAIEIADLAIYNGNMSMKDL